MSKLAVGVAISGFDNLFNNVLLLSTGLGGYVAIHNTITIAIKKYVNHRKNKCLQHRINHTFCLNMYLYLAIFSHFSFFSDKIIIQFL